MRQRRNPVGDHVGHLVLVARVPVVARDHPRLDARGRSGVAPDDREVFLGPELRLGRPEERQERAAHARDRRVRVADAEGVRQVPVVVEVGVGEEVGLGRKRLVAQGGLTYPVWDFDDVDVSAARDPVNKHFFRLSVDGVDARSNVWAHGADARSHFPRTDEPTAACSVPG
jgi:hypothetical protein